jgi:hypothetical protein
MEPGGLSGDKNQALIVVLSSSAASVDVTAVAARAPMDHLLFLLLSFTNNDKVSLSRGCKVQWQLKS